MPKIELTRVSNDYGFEAVDESGHIVKMDTNPASGGHDYGARPMQLLLMGLAGCSAIDVIGILNKQRQEVRDYKMIVNGERQAGTEPSLWKDINIEFHIYGNVDKEKAFRAVELSVDKYCSVAATLVKAGAEIIWKVFVHQESNE
jgi:putative redox protein